MHLIIDGYGGDRAKLADLDFIYRSLDEYPARIGMTKIGPPHVVRYVGSNPLDWGISGFVLIAESHISVHTFPERSYVNIDVFSCLTFDPEEILQDLKGAYGLTRVRSRYLERGLVYPHQMEAMAEATRAERLELLETIPQHEDA